jgi:type IV secretory pathway VirJ component
MMKMLGTVFLACALAMPLSGESLKTITIRGTEQQLHLYGPQNGPPIILSSGDLGWAGLVVYLAESLSARGYCIIGFNSKAYLSSFTAKDSTLNLRDVPGDFGVLIKLARASSSFKPTLAGISEGAGLSVLATTDASIKQNIQGILALGLPDQCELGWKWQDSIIWVTKKAPNEPSFVVEDIIAKVSPAPLAEIHSTHDEFVPLDKAKLMFAKAGEPKRMWVIEAANHRFSNNREELDRSIVEALEWIASRK